MRVWRVAHSTARADGFPAGPYSHNGVIPSDASARLWAMADDHSYGTHPSPHADFALGWIDAHERCGFDSRDALNSWFDDWTTALAVSGFCVWEYEVPDDAVRVGRRGQAVFSALEAVEVGRHDFDGFEQLTMFN